MFDVQAKNGWFVVHDQTDDENVIRFATRGEAEAFIEEMEHPADDATGRSMVP